LNDQGNVERPALTRLLRVREIAFIQERRFVRRHNAVAPRTTTRPTFPAGPRRVCDASLSLSPPHCRRDAHRRAQVEPRRRRFSAPLPRPSAPVPTDPPAPPPTPPGRSTLGHTQKSVGHHGIQMLYKTGEATSGLIIADTGYITRTLSSNPAGFMAQWRTLRVF